MSMFVRIALVVAFLATLAVPAHAQTTDPDFSAKITGAVAPDQPLTIEIDASSPVLWSGHIVAKLESLQLFQALELPAGSQKSVTLVLPAPSDARQVRIVLVDRQGEEAGRVTLQLAAAFDGPRVAAVDVGPDVLRSIEDARSTPMEIPPHVQTLDLAAIESVVSYDYLALDQPIGGAELLAVVDWVMGGGRVVGPEFATRAFDVESRGEWGDLEIAVLGEGEVITIPDELLTSAGAWSLALRDVRGAAITGFAGQEFDDPYSALGQAASGAGGSTLALIPWLFTALTIYVIVTGPVNLLVLRRLKRPELGWITVPIIALIGVLGLWFFGPRQSSVIVNQATVLVGGTDATAYTAFSLVPSNDGKREIVAPDASLIGGLDQSGAVFQALDGAAVGLSSDMKTGRTATIFTTSPSGGSLRATVGADGSVTVINDSDVTFDQWGVMAGMAVTSNSNSLAPGASASIRPGGAINIDPWDPVLMQQLWNTPQLSRGELVWQAYRPLLVASEQLVSGVRSESFVWAIAGESTQTVEIDGSTRSADGITIAMTEVDIPPQLGAESTGSLLGFEGLNQEGPLFLWGNGFAVFSFKVAPDAENLRVGHRFGQEFGIAFLVLDPTTGEFLPTDDNGRIADAGRLVTPTGEVFVKIQTTEEREIDVQSIVVEASA